MPSYYKRPKARPDNSGAPVRNVDQNVMTEPSNQTFYQRLIAARADQCADCMKGNDLA